MNEELFSNLKIKLELFLNKILEENISDKKSVLTLLGIFRWSISLGFYILYPK